MNIFNLTASLTLDKSQYEQGIESAKSKGEDFKNKTEKGIGIIAANAWVELAQKVVQAGQKIAQVTLDLINYADKYGDLSAKYDMSTQSLQEFEYIASQSGATLETVLSTMTMMYNRAKEDDEVFAKLGVSVRDVTGNMKSMDTLFWEVKEAIDNVDNSGDKSALMLEAFGRNAMSLGEFLRKDTTELQEMANEAHELGIVLQEDAIDKAGDFNDKLDELKLQGQSAFAGLVLGAEDAEENFDKFLDNIVEAIEDIAPKVFEATFRVGKSFIKGIFKGIKDIFFDAESNVEIGDDVPSFKSLNSSQNEVLDNMGSLIDEDVLGATNYEINERQSTTMEIKLTASGTSDIDEENAEKIASKLVPIIDKKMGGI